MLWQVISMKKNVVSLVYKAALALVIAGGTAGRAGLFSGEINLSIFFSFTTISNMCVLAVTLFTIGKLVTGRGQISAALSRVRATCVIMILITGLVYHFVLLPQKLQENSQYNVFAYGNMIAHYVAPPGLLADWLVFDKKGSMKKQDPLILVSLPFAYFAVTSLYGYYRQTAMGDENAYVYFFMNWGELGVSGVLLWVLPIALGVIGLAYSIYFLDRWLGKKQAAPLAERQNG